MNVASQANCAELFGLSGWHDVDQWYYDGTLDAYRLLIEEGTVYSPAYNTGYLIRKFPHVFLTKAKKSGYRARFIKGRWGQAGIEKQITEVADTPEDALCCLIIHLIKEGLIDVGEKQ
jgi:hypothetical protein